MVLVKYREREGVAEEWCRWRYYRRCDDQSHSKDVVSGRVGRDGFGRYRGITNLLFHTYKVSEVSDGDFGRD